MKKAELIKVAYALFQGRVNKLKQDPAKVRDLLSKAETKINGRDGKSLSALEELKSLLNFIKSFYTGEYREVSKKSIFIILFAIFYFVFPMDIVPDFIPLTGFIDDSMVILWAVKQVGKELSLYQQWNVEKGDS